MDFTSESGYSEAHEARSKVGEPQDTHRLGVVPIDPTVAPDDAAIRWVTLPEAGDRATVTPERWLDIALPT